jgi:hypothetical protein
MGRDEDFKRKVREAATGGGVLLGGPGQIQVDPAQLRTFHTTDFRNCGMDVQEILDDERKVTGFAIRVLDRAENHLYTYKFGQESLDAFRATLSEMHNVGDEVPAEPVVLN